MDWAVKALLASKALLCCLLLRPNQPGVGDPSMSLSHLWGWGQALAGRELAQSPHPAAAIPVRAATAGARLVFTGEQKFTGELRFRGEPLWGGTGGVHPSVMPSLGGSKRRRGPSWSLAGAARRLRAGGIHVSLACARLVMATYGGNPLEKANMPGR